MPRTLPWLKDQNKRPAPATTPPRPARHVVKTEVKTKIKAEHDLPNSVASSSPPAPTTTGMPAIEGMRPGDEHWVMVENEFLSAAQTFTRHLHLAEYQRFKEQNESRDQNISIVRPTTGPRPAVAQDKRDRRRAQINRAVADTHGHDANDDAEGDAGAAHEDDGFLIADRNLAALMSGQSPSKELSSDQVSRLRMPKSRTRAAAGLSRNAGSALESNGTAADSAPSASTTTTTATPRLSRRQPSPPSPSPMAPRDREVQSSSRVANSGPRTNNSHQFNASGDSSEDDFGIPQTSRSVASWRERLEQRRKREAGAAEANKVVKTEDDIPTFMI